MQEDRDRQKNTHVSWDGSRKKSPQEKVARHCSGPGEQVAERDARERGSGIMKENQDGRKAYMGNGNSYLKE